MHDCGPSRFAIWRRLQTESADNIVAQLLSVVTERGPCDGPLIDNSMAFRSVSLREFVNEWGITLRFSATCALCGNGIVERNHRTIKRIAERGGITPKEETFYASERCRRRFCLFKYLVQVPMACAI